MCASSAAPQLYVCSYAKLRLHVCARSNIRLRCTLHVQTLTLLAYCVVTLDHYGSLFALNLKSHTSTLNIHFGVPNGHSARRLHRFFTCTFMHLHAASPISISIYIPNDISPGYTCGSGSSKAKASAKVSTLCSCSHLAKPVIETRTCPRKPPGIFIRRHVLLHLYLYLRCHTLTLTTYRRLNNSVLCLIDASRTSRVFGASAAMRL